MFRIIFCLLFSLRAFATAQYYCTAADDTYFQKLLNLIGSIHSSNFDELQEIAVFDLGLSSGKVNKLSSMSKVKVYKIREENPTLLQFFLPGNTRPILGWYAWKPVVIKEALEMFPYVLWLDAGTTVLKPLDSLFEHIVKTGYFLSTIGDRDLSNPNATFLSLYWAVTSFVKNAFQLDDLANRWVLSKEFVLAGVVGSTKNESTGLVKRWYELSKDSRYFMDDGSAQGGFGAARHDQTILSILAYLGGLRVFAQDSTQKKPMMLRLQNSEVPLNVTWNGPFVSTDTHIYSSRNDLKHLSYYVNQIRYR